MVALSTREAGWHSELQTELEENPGVKPQDLLPPAPRVLTARFMLLKRFPSETEQLPKNDQLPKNNHTYCPNI